MLLRLDMTGAPRWLEMAPGVRFLVDPCSSTVMGLARESARLQELVESNASETALAVALAKEIGFLTIKEWEGVVGSDDKPLPVSEDTISAALDVPLIFQKFQMEHVASGLRLDDEKNGSAPSLNGTSGAETNTARRARPAAKSAPAKSTSRKQ